MCIHEWGYGPIKEHRYTYKHIHRSNGKLVSIGMYICIINGEHAGILIHGGICKYPIQTHGYPIKTHERGRAGMPIDLEVPICLYMLVR